MKIGIHLSRCVETACRVTDKRLISPESSNEIRLESKQEVFLEDAVLLPLQTKELPPDVFFIVIDALRADVLGTYGASHGVSPYMDILGKDSLVFEKNLVNSSWTRPSTLIFFTGLYASKHYINFWNYPVYPDEKEEFYQSEIYPLPAALSSLGYKTFMIGTNPFLTDHRYLGVDTGFEEVRDFSLIAGDDTPAITNDVIASLEKLHRQKFFTTKQRRPLYYFINYNTPHRPLKPPAKYLAKVKIKSPYHPKKRLYLGEVAYVDAEIHRLLQYLKKSKLYKKSLLLLTADHGEVMNPFHKVSRFNGVYTLFGHGQGLYDEDIHTPLFLKLPNNQYAGKRIANVSRSIDIMPSILDVVKSGQTLHTMDGSSLLTMLAGKEEPRVYYGESRGVKAIRKDGFKLQKKTYEFHRVDGQWDGTMQDEPAYLFDLQKDPEENTPITNVAVYQKLAKELESYRRPSANYTFRIYLPKMAAKRQIRFIVQSEAGSPITLTDRAKPTKLPSVVYESNRFSYQHVLLPGEQKELRFTIYPNVVFPEIQIFIDGRPIQRGEYGVGELDVYPGKCTLLQEECLPLFVAKYGAPALPKKFRVQLWREGIHNTRTSEKVLLEKDSLEILKKQGYIQ
ncbi:MAG: sulfatase [Spirochaetota bacterium]